MDVLADAGVGFWENLRRRKVLQWGVAYVAGAWGLLQGLLYVGTLFSWPEHVQRLAFVALTLALPIVLVVAWYHGDIGEQHVAVGELAAVSGLFVLGGAIFWWYGQRLEVLPVDRALPPSAAVSRSIEDSRPSIAVLPFANRSKLGDDQYFVDGIHDDILTQLTKVGSLRVIARTSVEQFRNTKLTTKEIGKKLRVSRILEGGVQRAGDRVRVTVQLVDANSDGHMWAESYDRDLTAANLFAIQSEIAAAIANTLNTTLNASEAARVRAVPTTNLEAWEAYQLGRQRIANPTKVNLVVAEKYFTKAIELDPTFAIPYADLAATLMAQVGWAGFPEATNMPRAEELVRQAIELGPTASESWAASAWVALLNNQPGRAEAEFRKAIALNPNYALGHMRLASLLSFQGRSEEALAHSTTALNLDPLSAAANFSNGRILASLGRFEEAEVRYRNVMELEPLRPNTYRDLAMLEAYARNRFVQAVPLAEKLVQLDPDAPYARCNLSEIYMDLDDLTQAAQVLQAALKSMPDSGEVHASLATVHLYQGDEASAVRLAREALAIDPKLSKVDVVVLGTSDLQRRDYAAARTRYARAFPGMLKPSAPEIMTYDLNSALDFVSILRMTGEVNLAASLLRRAQEVVKAMPRLGESGYGLADAQVHALHGNKAEALAALRSAEEAGWRGPSWRYYRDYSPALNSIRDEPQFQVVFADIERDMSRQRSELEGLVKAVR